LVQPNRARLVRIKVAKRVPVDYLHPAYTLAQRHLDAARKAEAKAKAALRSACAKADPAALVIDVEASEARPLTIEAT